MVCELFGMIGRQQRRNNAKGFRTVKQDAVEPACLRRLLRQHPWLVFDDVLVDAGNQLPHAFEHAGKIVIIELRDAGCDNLARKRAHVGVTRGLAWRWNDAAAIFRDHRHRPAQKIAQIVGEITVGALNQGVIAEIAVLAKHHLTQDEIAEQLRTEYLVELIRIQNIAARFGHLFVLVQPPAMSKDCLRRFQSGRKQKCRPIDGMKSQNVLADKMNIGRPVFRKLRVVGFEIECRSCIRSARRTTRRTHASDRPEAESPTSA